MNLLYWISTGLISGFLFLSSYTYLFSDTTIKGVRELGFPDFFRWELAALKLLAGIILLVPNMHAIAKQWAYAGTFFFLLTALVAHVAHKDSIWITVLLLVLMSILFVSHQALPGITNK